MSTKSELQALTKAQVTILSALTDRALDVFDIRDATHLPVARVLKECRALRSMGLVDWMYVEDAVSIADAASAMIAQMEDEHAKA